jgi:hypothetical protein
MRVVPGREDGLLLGVMSGVRMGMVKGMVLVFFPVAVAVRTGLRSGQGSLRIFGLAIRPAAGSHGHTSHSLLIKGAPGRILNDRIARSRAVPAGSPSP